MTAVNSSQLKELISGIREEAEGDRGEYYEIYGSPIRPVLSPLAELLERNVENHPELVELVLLSFNHSSEVRREELQELLAQQHVADSGRKLWKFYWDCGRQGDVESIFVATQSEIDDVLGSEIYFGEILGKHSEIYGTLDSGDFSVISENPDLVELFEKHVGSTGHNPLDYLEEEE